MDYPAPKLMGFHFAKHLSLLVLASEREMSFDCATLCVALGAAAPVPVAALHRAAMGAAAEWGAWLRVWGTLLRRVSCGPDSGRPLLRAAPPNSA